MIFDDTQLSAISQACDCKFSIITGGAGTGKTTIIKSIADQLQAAGQNVYLCAFAGKAAARLKEATKREASTIHRMLGYMGTRFTVDSLKGKCVIVDESSMVDSELMAEIVKREPDKLILVGDEAQLPPVGKGQPFHDLISLRPDLVRNLTTCYRNSEAVFRAAMAIRNGQPVSSAADSANEKWRIVHTGDDQSTHLSILEQVRRGFFDFDRDAILCPKNGDDEMVATVDSLNKDIASIVHPRGLDETFVVGDRVMNTKNLAEKDIWNGTTGKIIAVNIDGGVHIDLDEPVIDWTHSTGDDIVYKSQVNLSKVEAKNLKLAYAITVHKAQGSQYRRVAFVCLTRDAHALLTRSLIYTAVTRTRQQCYVVGDRRAFVKGCETVTNKSTVLQQLAASREL
jgi:exodeoxyribonuclease V alpha subunit